MSVSHYWCLSIIQVLWCSYYISITAEALVRMNITYISGSNGWCLILFASIWIFLRAVAQITKLNYFLS